MEKCMRCGKAEEKVKIFDGIYVTQPVKICERCSLLAGIPIIKRPTEDQIKDSQLPLGVRPRLMRMAGLSVNEKKSKSVLEELNELENKPELEKPEEINYKLVDNYHWIIQNHRRRKCLSTKQLAERILDNEELIKLLEQKLIPKNAETLIKKLEQFFGVALIKRDFIETVLEKEQVISRSKEIVLPTIEKKEIKTLEASEIKVEAIKQPKPFDSTSFHKEVAERISIRDLQRLSNKIEEDMEFDKKTREQVGNDQIEGFGKEDTERIKRKILNENYKNKTPTLYELMKKKEERDKQVTGKEIQIINEVKYEDLE